MIIGIDDSSVRNEFKHRGIGIYTKHLIENLKKIDLINIETKNYSGCDVFIQPNFCKGLPKLNCPKIVVVHDLTPMIINHYSSHSPVANALKGVQYRMKLRSIRQADAIITDSKNTCKDVIKHIKVAPSKIHPVYLGLDSDFLVHKCINQKNRGNYILYYGGVEINKNLTRLLFAFKNMKHKNGLKLVLVGNQLLDKKKRETRHIMSKIREYGLDGEIQIIGFLPKQKLIDILQNALVFVYPSYYEGFGLPVLEAMAAGTPVVTSNTSSLPEIANDAALLVNPYEPNEIAFAINQIVHCKEEDYCKWIKKGQIQAKKFSWERCAKETYEVAKQLVK